MQHLLHTAKPIPQPLHLGNGLRAIAQLRLSLGRSQVLPASHAIQAHPQAIQRAGHLRKNAGIAAVARARAVILLAQVQIRAGLAGNRVQRRLVTGLRLRQRDVKLAGRFRQALAHRRRAQIAHLQALHIFADAPSCIAQLAGVVGQLLHRVDFGLVLVVGQLFQLLQQLKLLLWAHRLTIHFPQIRLPASNPFRALALRLGQPLLNIQPAFCGLFQFFQCIAGLVRSRCKLILQAFG